MANRSFKNDLKATEQGLVIMPGTVTIPAGGVPTADTFVFGSASLVTTGHYRISLEDPYVALRAATFSLENTGSQALRVDISGSNVGTTLSHATSLTTKHIDFFVMSGSNKTAPTSTVKVHGFLFLKNSGV